MADSLIQAGNNAAQTVAPALTPDQQKLSDNSSIPAGQPGSPWSTAPVVMTPAQAFNNTPVSVPSSTTPDQSSGLIAGVAANQNLNNTIASLTPEETPLDKQNQTLLNDISSLTGQDAGKQEAQIQEENKAGLPQLNSDVTGLNGQIATLTAQQAADEIAYQKKISDLGATQPGVSGGVITGQQNETTRQYQLQKATTSAQIGLLNAQVLAKNGQIANAQATANRAVDVKFSPIEDAIKVKQAQLNAIAPMLDKEQKTQALAQQVYLDKQKQDIQDAKDKETQINNIMLNAAQAGGSPQILAAIQKSPNVVAAIAAAAPALGAKVANELKQQAFDNAIKLRNAANDSARVAIEQQNVNINLAKLQLEQSNAAKAATNAVVTTPSGKKYIDGTNLDAAAKSAALNAGQVVLNGDSSKAMTAITNMQGQMGSLLSSLQQAGVVGQDGKFSINNNYTDTGDLSNKGATFGFLTTWAAGSATPAVKNFGDNLKPMITDLQKLPGTGNLVATLQNNVLTGKEDAATMQTKIKNITTALEDSENSLLVDNSKPAQMNLNGKILNLQADGTYQ